MDNDTDKCRLCGQDIWEMTKRGAWLERVGPKGDDFIGECRPSCDRNHGNQNDALLGALAQEQSGE